MTPAESVKMSYPDAICMKKPKERYVRYRCYTVFTDGDPENEIGQGSTPATAWKDAWEMVQYLMLWHLEG